jgi:hypothetical protein
MAIPPMPKGMGFLAEIIMKNEIESIKTTLPNGFRQSRISDHFGIAKPCKMTTSQMSESLRTIVFLFSLQSAISMFNLKKQKSPTTKKAVRDSGKSIKRTNRATNIKKKIVTKK